MRTRVYEKRATEKQPLQPDKLRGEGTFVGNAEHDNFLRIRFKLVVATSDRTDSSNHIELLTPSWLILRTSDACPQAES